MHVVRARPWAASSARRRFPTSRSSARRSRRDSCAATARTTPCLSCSSPGAGTRRRRWSCELQPRKLVAAEVEPDEPTFLADIQRFRAFQIVSDSFRRLPTAPPPFCSIVPRQGELKLQRAFRSDNPDSRSCAYVLSCMGATRTGAVEIKKGPWLRPHHCQDGIEVAL